MKPLRFLGLILAMSVVVFACTRAVEGPDAKLRISTTYPGDVEMWDHIFDVKEPYKFNDVPLGVILPHHLIVADELAKIYAGLSKVTHPKMIVVISPNHYQSGDGDIQTCKTCQFDTTKGVLKMDDDFAKGLVEAGVAAFGDETFVKEHGIYNHAPFVKKYFPDAEIVPIVLKWKISQEETEKLSEWLNEKLPNDALVVTSVDFSHYVPVEVADFHDWSSYATIKNFDYSNVYDLEIDSPSSIYAMLKLMDKRGYQKTERLAHTNLQDYVSHRESTTSHQFFAFYKGEVEKVQSITIQAWGDMFVNKGLGFSKGWFNLEGSEFLKDLRGQEDRFLVGTDYTAFDLDEGCKEEMQNSVKVAFCKFTESDDLEQSVAKIHAEKYGGYTVYLVYQFNVAGRFNAYQETLAEKFVDAGVDIFVGRGLKEIVPMKIYKSSLIFYSLDNLVGSDALSASLGIVILPEKIYVYVFPLKFVNSYPVLLDFEERASFFTEFVKALDPKSVGLHVEKMLIEVVR